MTIETKGPYKIVSIGEVINGENHQRCISPDADYSNETAAVKAVCKKAFTSVIKMKNADRPAL